jgi:hypothetical protein
MKSTYKDMELKIHDQWYIEFDRARLLLGDEHVDNIIAYFCEQDPYINRDELNAEQISEYVNMYYTLLFLQGKVKPDIEYTGEDENSDPYDGDDEGKGHEVSLLQVLEAESIIEED